jgi:hypothetical protein
MGSLGFRDDACVATVPMCSRRRYLLVVRGRGLAFEGLERHRKRSDDSVARRGKSADAKWDA